MDLASEELANYEYLLTIALWSIRRIENRYNRVYAYKQLKESILNSGLMSEDISKSLEIVESEIAKGDGG